MTLPRCTATNRDGSQCSRRVTNDSQPPTCHIHLAKQIGGQGLTQPAPFNPTERLTRIASNDRHPQQIQAIKMLREDRGCAACAARAESARATAALVRAITDVERAELTELLLSVRAFKERIYDRCPEARPASTV